MKVLCSIFEFDNQFFSRYGDSLIIEYNRHTYCLHTYRFKQQVFRRQAWRLVSLKIIRHAYRLYTYQIQKFQQACELYLDEIIFHAYHSVGMETVGMLMVGMEVDLIKNHSPYLPSPCLPTCKFSRHGDCFSIKNISMPTVYIPTASMPSRHGDGRHGEWAPTLSLSLDSLSTTTEKWQNVTFLIGYNSRTI